MGSLKISFFKMVDCSKKKLNITQRKTDTYIKTEGKIMNKRERERERDR